MKFMLILKSSKDSEAGVFPPDSKEMFEKMGKFNEELAKAGMLLAAEGLTPSSKGVRISFNKGGKPTVTDGPFAETKELIAGFWILQAKSRDEVVAWLSRAPFDEGEVEIRPVGEFEDLPADILSDDHAERRRKLEQSMENASRN